MEQNLYALIAAWGVGFVFNQVLGGLIRSRFAKGEELEREIMRAIVKDQSALADRLREDRESAAKHFEGLWSNVKHMDNRLIRLETHHAHNHPGQTGAPVTD